MRHTSLSCFILKLLRLLKHWPGSLAKAIVGVGLLPEVLHLQACPAMETRTC